jgi:hypothetical protein
MKEGNLHSIQREDDGDLRTGRTCVEDVLEMRHGDDRGHQGPIISIGTSATESHKDRVYSISMYFDK